MHILTVKTASNSSMIFRINAWLKNSGRHTLEALYFYSVVFINVVMQLQRKFLK